MNTPSDFDVDLSDETVANRKGKKRVRIPVRVGENYQADLPVYTPGRVHEDYPEKAMLVWVPSIIEESELDKYEATAVTKFGYSKEQALAMLCWHKYDLSGAYRDLAKFTPVPSEWSNYDKLLFEHTLKNVGKKFEAIQKNMPGKSVKSLVGYYFSTERSNEHSAREKILGGALSGVRRVFSSYSPLPTNIIRGTVQGRGRGTDKDSKSLETDLNKLRKSR